MHTEQCLTATDCSGEVVLQEVNDNAFGMFGWVAKPIMQDMLLL